MWLELASHLKKTLQEVKQGTTSTEFLLWIAYLRRLQKENTREQFYLAQIAAEVRRSHVKYPEKVKISHLLLKFGKAEKKKEKKSLKQRIEESKRFWCRAVGLNYNKECGKDKQL